MRKHQYKDHYSPYQFKKLMILLLSIFTGSLAAVAQPVQSQPCNALEFISFSPENNQATLPCDLSTAYMFTMYYPSTVNFFDIDVYYPGGKQGTGAFNYRTKWYKIIPGSPKLDLTVLLNWYNNGDFWYHSDDTGPIFSPSAAMVPGEYEVWIQQQVLGGYSTVCIGRYLVINKPRKVWVEAPAICASDYIGNPTPPDYTFAVKTDPEISDIAFPSAYLDINYQLTVDGGNIAVTGLNHIEPSNPWVTGVSDGETQTIDGDDIKAFLTNNTVGTPLMIDMQFDDNVTSVTKDITAPIIINTDFNYLTHPFSSTDPAATFHHKHITVTGSEVWTPTNNPATKQASSIPGTGTAGPTIGTLRVAGDITITPGSSLVIEDMDVEFGPSGKVVVQANPGTTDYGGRLKLDNSTLVAYHGGGCSNTSVNYLWPGVIVKGNASKSQAILTPNGNGARYYQGILEMEDNSTIALAANGVQLWGGTLASSGGIIHARNSNFTNNKRGVEFEKYSGIWPTPNNISFFQQCNFTTNDVLPSPFFCFISAWGVKNVKIKGCFFSDSEQDPYGTNYGVFGEDASFIVEKYGTSNSYPTLFTELKQAFRVNDITGLGGMFVKNSQFDANGIGIFSRGVKAPSVTHNDFSVGTVGLRLETGTGFAVRHNVFDLGSEDAVTVGTLAWNTGSDPNLIASNEYNDLFEGSLNNFLNRGVINGQPSGLQYHCNAYDGVEVSIAALGFYSPTDGIAENQGNNSVPTGNDLNSTAVDLYNDVAAFNYYYYNGDPTPSSQGSVTKIGVGDDAPCPGTDEIGDFPGGAAHIFGKIQHFLYDSTAIEDEHNRDSLYYWVDRWGSPYGSVMKSDMLMEDGYREAALALYANITTEYEMDEGEVAEFDHGYTLLGVRAELQEEELSLKDIDLEQLATIEEVAESATAWAKVRAQNWLTLYDGRDFDNTVLHVELDPPLRKIAVSDQTKLYPNPVNEAITVSYVNKGENGSILQVSDITGRMVLIEKLEGTNGHKIVNVSKLISGLYLYKIVEDDQTTLQGKFVKE